MELSLYSWFGLGLTVISIFGIDKYGIGDYKVISLLTLAVCFLLVDVIKFYKDRF